MTTDILRRGFETKPLTIEPLTEWARNALLDFIEKGRLRRLSDHQLRDIGISREDIASPSPRDEPDNPLEIEFRRRR